MTGTQKILIAVDPSERAHVVLAEGLKLAAALGAKVTVLRAIPNLHDVPVALPVPLATLRKDMLREARDEIGRLSKDIPVGRLDGVLVEEGSPWQVICRAAQTSGASVVVVGAYGQSGFAQVLGSTATRVVNHAPCSVLVVRTPAPA